MIVLKKPKDVAGHVPVHWIVMRPEQLKIESLSFTWRDDAWVHHFRDCVTLVVFPNQHGEPQERVAVFRDGQLAGFFTAADAVKNAAMAPDSV